MKIVIGHSITKREILGEFSILGSKEDLERISQQIQASLAAHESQYGQPFCYGWIDIRDRLDNPAMTNLKPKGWD
jgi:hypothetical protein